MSSIIKGIQRIVAEEVSSVIYQLSQKYGFDFDEEYDAFLANFALSNKTQKIKQPKPLKEKTSDKSPKWKLPFNGTINHSFCHAICRADGLYNQCKRTPFDESDLCKTCQNYMLKNDKLPYGRIEERAEVGLYEFRFGKYAPLHYSLYMKKHNLSRETVEEYTASIGITLDEQHFAEVQEPPKKKGGRKPKSPIQVVNATNDNNIMQDIFGPDAHADDDSDSDSDDSDSDDSDSDDSDDGLQFSKKSNKNHILAKKPEVKQPEPAKKPPVLAKEPVVVKKHEVNAKESKKPEPKQPEPVLAKKSEVKTKKPEPKQPEPVIAKKSEVKTKKPEAKQPEPLVAKKSNKTQVKEPEPLPIISSGKHGEIWTIPQTEEPEPEPELQPETIPEPQKVTVKKFTYAGVKYLRNPIDNSIFDLNHKLIGSFNPDSMCLELFDQQEEEEEEEEEEDDEDDDDDE
jgi:hypothetical protein